MPDHSQWLAPLDLSPRVAASVDEYLSLLARWDERTNLTAARTPAERVQKLVVPVLPARAIALGDSLIDVGSGNGSPGLILAVLNPEVAVTLLEPRQRRWAFLREAVRHLGLQKVEAVRVRHDQYDGLPAWTVTVRALALSAADLSPMVKTGGQLLFFGKTTLAETPFNATEHIGTPDHPILRVYGERST